MFHYIIRMKDGNFEKEKLFVKGIEDDYYGTYCVDGKDYPLDNPFVTKDFLECHQITCCEDEEFIFRNLLAFIQSKLQEHLNGLNSLYNAYASVKLDALKSA